MKKPTLIAGAVALAAFVAGSAFAVAVAQTKLLVHLDDDFLRISAPRLSFLSGSALDRLKSGSTVAFVGQLTVAGVPNAVVADARSVARFALSYDIWEEKFSVTRFGDRPEARRTVSHLSAQATERWCLDSMAIAYAQRHPQRVNGLVLRGVFLGSAAEHRWLWGNVGAARLAPWAWQRLCAAR